MSTQDGGPTTEFSYEKDFRSGQGSVFMFMGKRPMKTLEFTQCSDERMVALYVVSERAE